MSFRTLGTAIALLVVIPIGCSGRPSRIPQPEINAVAVADAAVVKYDKDGNLFLDANELSEVESLSRSLGRLDTNHDNQLSCAEIAARIEAWHQYGAGLVQATCTVLQNGNPVTGATVTYSPEDFFRGSILPAYGKTNGGGRTILSVAEAHRPKPVYKGLHTGFYRIAITLANGSSVDAVNDGIEIAGDLQNDHTVVIP